MQISWQNVRLVLIIIQSTPDIALSVHHNLGSHIKDSSKPKYCNFFKCIILTSKDKKMLYTKYKYTYQSIQGSSNVQYLQFIVASGVGLHQWFAMLK